MKLKDLIIKIEERLFFSNPPPSLVDYMINSIPSIKGRENAWHKMAEDIESYLNKFFLLKNEGIFWIKSINCEFEEIKKRIKFLEEIIVDRHFQENKNKNKERSIE